MLLHMMGDIRSIYISDYTHTWWGFRSWMWMCADRIMIIWNLTWVFFCWISCYISLWLPTAVWVCISAFISVKPPQLSNIQTDRFENCLWRQKADVFDRMLGNRKSRSSPCFQRDRGTCSCVSCDQNSFFKAEPWSFPKPNQVFFVPTLKRCCWMSSTFICRIFNFFIFIQNQTLSTLNTYILTFITNMWNNYFIFFLIYVSLTHTWSINLSLCTFLLNLCPANTCIYFLLWLTTRQTKDEPLTPNF